MGLSAPFDQSKFVFFSARFDPMVTICSWYQTRRERKRNKVDLYTFERENTADCFWVANVTPKKCMVVSPPRLFVLRLYTRGGDHTPYPAMLSCEEVDEVLGYTKTLLLVLEDTISRCKTLIAVVAESHWRSADLAQQPFVLHGLEGRFHDVHSAAQNLCKELFQFKSKLGTLNDAGSFYERIQASIEQKEIELEKMYVEVQTERSILEEERRGNANAKGKCKRCSSKKAQEYDETGRNERICSDGDSGEEEGVTRDKKETIAEERKSEDGDQLVEEALVWQLKLQIRKSEEALEAKLAAERDLRDATAELQSQKHIIEALEEQLVSLNESDNGGKMCFNPERDSDRGNIVALETWSFDRYKTEIIQIFICAILSPIATH